MLRYSGRVVVIDASLARQAHILVGEDDDALATMVTTFLTKRGYRVSRASDGQGVIDALARSEVDLVLLDVMMPNKTGFEVLRELRAAGDTTPIIMATALAMADDIVKALEAGADDYVTKPFSLPVLAARVDLRMRPRPLKAPESPRPQARHDADRGDAAKRDAGASNVGGNDANVSDAREGLSDAVVVDESWAVTNAADEQAERGLFARLRAAAEVFRKRKAPKIAIAPGSKLAERYLLGPVIGEGGFGVVFKAKHLDLDQSVAIKVMRSSEMTTSIEQFKREAQSACRVRHDHAVRVMDFGIDANVAYFVMELLNGPSAEDDVVANGAFELTRATTVVRCVLSALAAAHAQGMVHRDVKPHNIVLHHEGEREIPKLLDFGIARSIGDNEQNGVLVGSGAYIAPERIRGEPYDGRADVYAMGIVLYRLLTASFPFEFHVDDFENLAKWHLHGTSPPPSQKNRDVTPAVDKAVLRLMERDPSRRPTAEEAATLVEQLIWG